MSIYVVTAVRRDPVTGEISRVRWGMADPAVNGWAAREVEADAIDVVDAIMAGDTVTTLHAVSGGHVPGKDVRVEDQPNGIEVLRSADSDDVKHLGLEDLPQF